MTFRFARQALVATAGILLGGAPVHALQTLSDTEQAIIQVVGERANTAIDFLERIVNINSGSMNFSGVRQVGSAIRAEFDGLGFETEWVEGASFNRSGHLMARRVGDRGPHLLLIGHLDTVFEPNSPFQTFVRGENETAKGPGVVDMKGGDVVILEALHALESVGVLHGMTITVIMTGDEERSGRPLELARAALIEAAELADIAIAFENGDSDPATAVVSRRGSTGWRLNVRGNPSHSSQIFKPEVGAGAIYEASRVLATFYGELAGEPLLTFNPGVIIGGTAVDYETALSGGSAFGKSNVVAESATVTGDLRTISLEQLARTRARMAFIAEQSLPGTSSELIFGDGYPPLAPSLGNDELLALFDQVSRDLGFGPVTAVNPLNAGAADVSFAQGLVEMAIDGLGPGGGNDHTVDEWIDLPTLALQSQRAAVLMYRLTR
jgi:glutamate carboxypeptidase